MYNGLCISKTLIADVKIYLHEAGFNNLLYKIIHVEDREYLEVHFCCNEAVYYIIDDIMKSRYSDKLEIKKYRHKNGIFSAIFAYV